jgi:hypothetical protein
MTESVKVELVLRAGTPLSVAVTVICAVPIAAMPLNERVDRIKRDARSASPVAE